jgi:hypothetical protein
MSFCLKCGTENNENSIYCQKCGAQLNVSRQAVDSDTKTSDDVDTILEETPIVVDANSAVQITQPLRKHNLFVRLLLKIWNKFRNARPRNKLIVVLITIILLFGVISGIKAAIDNAWYKYVELPRIEAQHEAEIAAKDAANPNWREEEAAAAAAAEEKRLADEKAKADAKAAADEKAKAEAEEKAKADAEEKAQQDADSLALQTTRESAMAQANSLFPYPATVNWTDIFFDYQQKMDDGYYEGGTVKYTNGYGNKVKSAYKIKWDFNGNLVWLELDGVLVYSTGQ